MMMRSIVVAFVSLISVIAFAQVQAQPQMMGMGSSTESNGGSFQPSGPMQQGSGSYQPKAGSFQPNGSSYQPNGGSYQPSGGSYQSSGGSYQSSGGAYPSSNGSYSRSGSYSDIQRPSFTNCPFQAEDKDISSAWNAAKLTLSSIEHAKQGCQQAVDQLRGAMESQSSVIGQNLQDQTLASRARLHQIEGRLAVLDGTASNCSATSGSTTTAGLTSAGVDTGLATDNSLSGTSTTVVTATVTSTCSEKDTLIAEATALRTQIDLSDNQRDAGQVNQARQATFQSVKSALDSVPTIQSACADSGAQVQGTIASAGFSLLSSASPLLIGANVGVSAMASILSSLVSAFHGRDSAAKGLSYMQRREDLENISCLYFQTMRLQCTLSKGQAHIRVADAQRLEDIRSLFESAKDNALGERMRSLFTSLYGDRKKALGPAQAAMVPQFCAMMANVPGTSDRCPAAAPGATYSDCRYMDYWEHGTNIQTPAARESFPKDAPPATLMRGNR